MRTWGWALLGMSMMAGVAMANDAGSPRMNYMLHCSGCHGQDASGSPEAGVPKMANALGHFLKVNGGREFLIQVPGTSQSALTDGAVAELMNWVLKTFSRHEMPPQTPPYTASEIAQLRATPLSDVVARRQELIKSLQAQGVAME